jgi:hypothetical protein
MVKSRRVNAHGREVRSLVNQEQVDIYGRLT